MTEEKNWLSSANGFLPIFLKANPTDKNFQPGRMYHFIATTFYYAREKTERLIKSFAVEEKKERFYVARVFLENFLSNQTA